MRDDVGTESESDRVSLARQALATGRWVLVDYFERDGQIHILARRDTTFEALSVLTASERAVVELAARGLHNKAIAFELGLAHSTVRVLSARAASKLGARSRRELVDLVTWTKERG
ncbi:MAG TPA: helix-turn-helix transcriptional regulator [Polyangiaceae bacterium]|nr:helix-turn-helix transcriptional regulator [Polyangiaceae bacterium]